MMVYTQCRLIWKVSNLKQFSINNGKLKLALVSKLAVKIIVNCKMMLNC